MRHPRSFRPTLTILEDRWVPAVAAYPDPFRNLIANAYATQAATGSNPVVFLGDSITFNWGTATRSGPGSSSFQQDFASMNAANFGIGGDTTDNLLYRVENGDLAGKPRLAVVMIGLNDLNGGASPEQAASGVAAVVHQIRAQSPDTKVLLLSVLPTGLASINAGVTRVDDLISGLGKEAGVTYLDLRQKFQGGDGMARPEFLMDTAHPSSAGYQAIAGPIDAAILGLLKSNQAPSAPEPTAPGPTASVTRPPTAAKGSASHPVKTATPANLVIATSNDPGVLLPLVEPEVPTHHHKPSPGARAVGPRS